MYLVDLDCKWYGTSPFCFGKCSDSDGRHPYLHSSGMKNHDVVPAKGFGNDCFSGTKAYCCDKKSSAYQPEGTKKGMYWSNESVTLRSLIIYMIPIYAQCNVSLNSGNSDLFPCMSNVMCLSQPDTTCINGRCIPLGNMNLSKITKI